jgi:hypothetical protein
MRKLSYTGRKLSDNLRRWLATKIVGLSLSALSIGLWEQASGVKVFTILGKVPTRESSNIWTRMLRREDSLFLALFKLSVRY